MYTYNIHYKSSDRIGLSPNFKTIKALRNRYLDVLSWSKKMNYNDIEEIVVLKGRKIHGFYDKDFKLDKSKPVFVHNMFYGLEK